MLLPSPRLIAGSRWASVTRRRLLQGAALLPLMLAACAAPRPARRFTAPREAAPAQGAFFDDGSDLAP